MPKGKKAQKKAKSKIPPWGRSEKHVRRDMGLHDNFAADVPIGNTDPTVVQGRLYGGMPNRSRKATGGLKQLKGKHTRGGAY